MKLQGIMPGIEAKGHDILDLIYLHTKIDEVTLFEHGEYAKIFSDLQRALNASEKHSYDKDTVIFASASIKRIMTLLKELNKPLPVRFFKQLFLYIRRVWDHISDVVCHDAVDIYSIIVTLHLRQCKYCLERKPGENQANCDRIMEMVQSLLEQVTYCRSRYRCLQALVAQCPTLSIYLTADFFNRAYDLMPAATLTNVIGELIILTIEYDDHLWDFHITAIRKFIGKHGTSVIKNRLLKMIVKKPLLRPFLDMLSKDFQVVQSDIELDMMLETNRCLINTQKLAFKTKKEAEAAAILSWTDYIPHRVMMDAIIHVNTEVGISAFKLIIEHPKKTLPFTEQDIEMMRVFLDANMTVQSSAARNSILATLKLALFRLGEASEILLKADEDSEVVASFIVFVKCVAKSAFSSLSTQANFNRRIMSLSMIDLLYNRENYIAHGKSRFVDKLKLDDTLGSLKWKQVLKRLDDSYEICQTTALKILKTVDFGHVVMNEDEYLRASTGLMTSMNSRYTAASGYRMQYFLHRHPERLQPLLDKFMEKCEQATASAEEKLLNITLVAIHPILNMIEQLLENSNLELKGDEETEEADGEKMKWWKHFVTEQLLPLCYRIVGVVTPVVHAASPEGYFPEAIDVCNKAPMIYAEMSQQLLACCWRAHKHLSAIFAWIIKIFAPREVISDDDVNKIGLFYWNQLTECKHRGAFECAVEGFTKTCRFLWTSENPNHPKPQSWLDDILKAINGQRDISNLCTTRRSAGLPHLVVAIVSTEPAANNFAALKQSVDSLLNMTDKSEKYRIHSMDVMKGIVSSAALRDHVAFALEKTFYVAINACRAQWSERNAASQLFVALKNRIFGVGRTVQRNLTVDEKNRQSSYEFFSKFPSLYKFLYEQLLMKQSEFSALPTLVLLTHLRSSQFTADIYPMSPFIPPLMRIALQEKRENLRSHACAAIMAIANDQVHSDLCDWIAMFKVNEARENHIHCFLTLIEGFITVPDHHMTIMEVVERIAETAVFKNWSDYNINIFLRIANHFETIYDIYDVPMEKSVLSKRPIVLQMLIDRDAFKIETSGWFKDYETRREIYRAIQTRGWSVCNVYLCAHIIAMALKDLELSVKTGNIPECEAKAIMNILSKGEEFMNPNCRKEIKRVVEEGLARMGSQWTLVSTKAAAMELKYLFKKDLQSIDEELIDWITESFDCEDPVAREIALDVGCRFAGLLRVNTAMSAYFYRLMDLKLISSVALFLQDDEFKAREKASNALSRLVNCSKDMPLNPAVCRFLISKWIFEKSALSAHFESKDEEDDEITIASGSTDVEPEQISELFDTCSINQFAESIYFGDIQLYEPLLQRMVSPGDVFTLDMDDMDD